jgi:hypothetical protein
MLKNRVSLTCEFLYKENNNKEYSENFGILNIELSELNVLYEKIEWIFTIDRSGSMADKCKDKKTKMEQIHYTLTNMIKYLNTLNLDQDITIIAIKSQSAIKGEMFLATRIESQRSERVYNLNNIDEIVEDTSDNLEHTMSENLTSPYENNTALSIMRCVSSTLQK